MVLEGQTTGAGAQVTRHRITWTPNADGSVRQFWESTDDKGRWSTCVRRPVHAKVSSRASSGAGMNIVCRVLRARADGAKDAKRA